MTWVGKEQSFSLVHHQRWLLLSVSGAGLGGEYHFGHELADDLRGCRVSGASCFEATFGVG